MAAQKQYELVYIASPDATEDQLTELQSLVEGIITKANGTIDKADVWGRRRLAYQIGRHKEGHYVVLLFSCAGELVKELDRRLKVNDTIIRHLTVRIDEDLRVAERLRSERKSTQARRRTARGLPPEPLPSERRGDRDDMDSDDMGLGDVEGMR